MDKYVLALDNLCAKGVFIKEGDKIKLAENWEKAIESILAKRNKEISESQLSVLAKKMRDCFPEGKMPGTAYYYKCNNREVMLKMKKFFELYGYYDDDEIIDATKRFVASFNGNYRYLPLIKYFISKNKTLTNEEGKHYISEVSELASYLENTENNENNYSDSDDWLMNARN
jgi:hypothetical protein